MLVDHPHPGPCETLSLDIPTPKGSRPSAQGWPAFEAYPGSAPKYTRQPRRGCICLRAGIGIDLGLNYANCPNSRSPSPIRWERAGVRVPPHSAGWLWLFFVCLAFLLPTLALDQRPIAIAELTQKADLVIRGRVLSKTCQKDSDGRIYTTVELAVLEVWKGKPQGQIQKVVHGGGIVGEERSMVPGQVDYKLEEEVVAFLVFNPRGEAVTLGLSQGKFDVWLNATNGQKEVRNPFWGAAPRQGSIQAAAAGAQALTLVDLKQKVEAASK